MTSLVQEQQDTNTTVPRTLTVLSIAVIAVAAIITILGAHQIGITWDERTNMASLQNYFDQGWNITGDAIVNGKPDPNYIWGIYVYGPVALLATHLVSTLAGVETWGDIQFTAEAYAVRHVAGAFIGLVGILAVGLTVRSITRSWRWGILGAAMLAVVPMWTGHSMMNIKDTPVATGFTVATLGLVLVMRTDYLTRKSVRIAGLASVFIGAFLASGTRAASGVPIAASAVGACLMWWLLYRRSASNEGFSAAPSAFRRLIEVALALSATYLALVIVYPNVWKNPIVLAYEAVVVSARFPFDEPIMFAGTWIDQPVPWTYLPVWFGAQLPILIVLGAAIFIVAWALSVIRVLTARSCALPSSALAESAPVLLQALPLPLVAIVLQATLYNAVRQYLFIVPALAIAATLGLWLAVNVLRRRGVKPVILILTWVFAGLGLVAPTVSQVLLYPYTYVSYNAVTAITPIDGRWPTDYWRASSNELVRRLPAQGPESCAYEQTRRGTLWACTNEPMFKPYLNERGVDAKPGTLLANQYWLIRENHGRTADPQGCTLHDEITRNLFWQSITIGQIYACDSNAVVPENGPAAQ